MIGSYHSGFRSLWVISNTIGWYQSKVVALDLEVNVGTIDMLISLYIHMLC